MDADQRRLAWQTAMVGLVVGSIVTLAATRYANNTAWTIAERSGQFRQMDLRLRSFGFEVTDRETWFYFHPGTKGVGLLPINLQIVNEGDKETGPLLVTVTAPKGLLVDDSTRSVKWNMRPGVLADQFRRSYADYASASQVTYSLKSLSPRSGGTLVELLRAVDTRPRPLPSVGVIPDSNGFTIRGRSVSYPITVTIAPEDAPSLTRRFGVAFVPTDSVMTLRKLATLDMAAQYGDSRFLVRSQANRQSTGHRPSVVATKCETW